MSQLYNIYCDESCHLENDHQHVMLLGCVWCCKDISLKYATDIRNIQNNHNAHGEIKWAKVSMSRVDFYKEIVEWYFSRDELFFRSVVVANKDILRHDIYNENSHDTFYYKMYFSLLSKVLSPDCFYNIYLDVKDTRSRFKLRALKEILCNNVHDFTNGMISHIQNIHSYESSLMQLCDLFMGALSYRHRGLKENAGKVAVVEAIERMAGRSLLASTSLREQKFNIFVFHPRQGDQ